MRSVQPEILAGKSLLDGTLVERLTVEEEVTILFDQLRGPVLRYLLSMGLSVADGEEVVQDVFLALFRHLRAGKPRDNLRGWIFKTGHNLGLKTRTRKPVAGPPVGETPTPEDQLIEKRKRKRVEAVIAALSEPDRGCLTLRAEGLTFREIANILGISLGGVALCLERALHRINRVNEG